MRKDKRIVTFHRFSANTSVNTETGAVGGEPDKQRWKKPVGKEHMKRIAQILMVGLALATTALGGSLNQEQIAGDAKWVLYLDFDGFRSTKVGDYFIKEILGKKLAHAQDELKQHLNFDLDLNKISSVTVYGTDYQQPKSNAVLLLKTSLNVQGLVDAAMLLTANADTNQPVPIKRIDQDGITIYLVHNAVCLSIQPGNLVVVGQSPEATAKAVAVLTGKSANLAASRTFSDFPEMKKAFFFLGMAEGFSSDAALPPQAKVLQMADGGCLVLGERADLLYLNLALKAKTAEVVGQMQQVIQGLVALATLSQPDNKDLMELTQSVKVSAADRVVSVSAEYPVDKAIQKLSEQEAKHHQEADAGSEPPSNKKKD
jgi:hypothetical protein